MPAAGSGVQKWVIRNNSVGPSLTVRQVGDSRGWGGTASVWAVNWSLVSAEAFGDCHSVSLATAGQ